MSALAYLSERPDLNVVDDVLASVNEIADGDAASFEEFFRAAEPWLRPLARRLAGQLLDPDDLLGDVLLAALTKMTAGPINNLGPYLVQAMRNRVKDELKSPRSQVVLTDTPEGLLPEVREDYRVIDLHHERMLVRRAMSSLTSEERAVLVSTAVEGLNPRDLEALLSRNAKSVSTLLYRAKAKLRRSILAVVVDEAAVGAECTRAVARVPHRLPAGTEDFVDVEPFASHVATCDACARSWQNYTHLSSLAA